jgi:MmyB-like transcription regulator ligand binding domain
VYDAAWNLIVANQPYDALMGETTSWRKIERNGVWRNLVGPGNRTVHTREEQARFESLLVADLRMTAARYPADRKLKRLIAELTTHSPRFAELWEAGEVGSQQDQSRHKIIDHPDVGLVALDCDVLIVAGDDLRIMVYTAEPGTEDAGRLALAIVLGTQALVD